MKRKYKKMKITCKECGEEKEAISKKKKFCSDKCRNKWLYHHDPKVKARVKRQRKERYERIKNTPKYKKQRAEYFKKWLSNIDNRQHYNDLMRKPNRLRARRIRIRDLRKGLCTKCHHKKEPDGFHYCLSCRKKLRVKHNKNIYIV